MENSERNEEEIRSISRNFTVLGFFGYAFPSMFAYIFNGLYSMVDGVFIERFVGPYAMSAVNLYYPVLNLLLAVGLMTGTGGSVALAYLMGKKEKEKADQMFSQLILTGLLVTVIITVAGLLFSDQIMVLLGATEGNLEYFRQYYNIMICASGVLIFSSMIVPLFFGEGRTAEIGILSFSGGVLNIGLDALFMGVFQWGIRGAAAATVIGYSATVLYALYFYAPFNKKGSAYRFGLTKLRAREIFPALYNGSSEMISNLASGATALIMNHLAYRFAGEIGVSVVSVFLYIQFFAMACFMGLTAAVEPVFSYHYGDENFGMLRKIFKLSVFWTAVLSVILTLICIVFRREITGFFFAPSGDTAIFYELALRSVTFVAPACLITGFNIFISGFFTGYSNGTVSMLLSLLRTFVILVISMLMLTYLFGADGLWLSWFAAEAVTLLVSALFFMRYRRRYLRPES